MERELPRDARVAAESLLDALGVLIERFQRHGDGDSRVEIAFSQWEEILDRLRALLPAGTTEVTVTRIGERFWLGSTALDEREGAYEYLRAQLNLRRASGVAIALDLERLRLVAVLRSLARAADDGAASTPPGLRWIPGGGSQRGSGSSRRSFELDHVLLGFGDFPIDGGRYHDALLTVSRLYDDASSGAAPDYSALERCAEDLVDAVMTTPERITPLVTIPYRRDHMVYHSVNVCLYALAAARAVVESRRMLRDIALAALVHDVGSALLPPDILDSDRELEEGEIRAILEHPGLGADWLLDHPGLPPVVTAVAFGHHLKDAPGGYPRVTGGFPVGPVTRLIAVVDTFESLSAHRPHRGALTGPASFSRLLSEPSYRELRPYVDLLAEAVGFHPLGSRVRTEAGQLGVVCGHAANDPRRPVVRRLRKKGSGLVLSAPVEALPIDAQFGGGPGGDDVVAITALDPRADVELHGSGWIPAS